ncbi:hypothetical protein [Rhodococcus sp. PvP104]|uniref:hypothetical protein n=1 Tax=Rhodococcus sp. PvP104 TaxID=2817911 RepID=UPI001AE9F823|nr:hypothetical protein [Rhodococcus sp. PvP104]MBP2527476.1 hypothetical protein [Rhodococcus sp. PvP104]
MIFQGIQLFESDAEEASRLAQAPIGSIDHGLSLLPVTLPYPARHHLIELPARKVHKAPGRNGGGHPDCAADYRIVVLPVTRHPGPTDSCVPSCHDSSWDCRIVASDHPSYPVGGEDICCSESELRRGRIIEIARPLDPTISWSPSCQQPLEHDVASGIEAG